MPLRTSVYNLMFEIYYTICAGTGFGITWFSGILGWNMVHKSALCFTEQAVVAYPYYSCCEVSKYGFRNVVSTCTEDGDCHLRYGTAGSTSTAADH